MSATILGAVSHQDNARATYHSKNDTYAAGQLGTWALQRLPHQRGCWHVQLHIRGMCVTGYAVQDDFGDLQMVQA